MKSHAAEQQTIREYLLGQLPSEQEAQFEERLLTDDDVFEELEIVEDELVDEYLRNELSPADRSGFESYFLASPEHQEKLRFARALRKYVSAKRAEGAPIAQQQPGELSASEPSQKSPTRFFPFRPVFAYAMAAAAIALVVLGAWFMMRQSTDEPRNMLAVELSPGLTRDGGIKSVRLASEHDGLQLRLGLPTDQAGPFQAVLQDAARETLLTQVNLNTQLVDGQPVVILVLPRSRLSQGEYRITLTKSSTQNTVATYSFRVVE